MKDEYKDRFGIVKKGSNGLKVVDLFCGAGVGAIGIKLAGFDIIYGIDNKDYAIETYNKNIGSHAVQLDIRKVNVEDIPDHDLMVATPTCKSFSWAGRNTGFDDKEHGDLIYHFVRLLECKEPKAFLFENVDGMLSKKNKPIFLEIMKDIKSIGYKVTWKVVDCYNYGVPQHRKRVFAIGIRNDIDKDFEFPIEIEDSLKTNIKYAIGDLPYPNMVLNSEKDIQYINNEKSCINNHIGYGVRSDEKEFVNKVSIGGNWRDLNTDDAKKFLGGAYNSGGGKTGFLRKVDFNKPSYTITSMMNGKNNAQIVDNQEEFNTPVPRRFTVRECLRLQTVPDFFNFDDSIKLSQQYERCSGIPSLMAYKLAIEIEKVLL